MRSIQSKLQRIKNALVDGLTDEGELLCEVHHYWRPKMSAPYVVWAEEGEADSFDADNRKEEQVLTGYIDFYTRTEFDQIADLIQDALYGLQDEPFTWRLDAVDFEDETNLIHYAWIWEAS